MAAGPGAFAYKRKLKRTAQIIVKILRQIHIEWALHDLLAGAAIIEIQKRMKFAVDMPIELRKVARMAFFRAKVKQDHNIQILRYKWTHTQKH
jgi:hypothetical protein